jgi:hypothetical protein
MEKRYKCREMLDPCLEYAELINISILAIKCCCYTGRFIMFSVITNIYNKKTKRPTLMGLFTATGKLKKFF